ncbi:MULTISPECIES: hypothetical protein [unclassified Paenibacillus]|uniref:hypothetical protein n=1 Tax=unclassified Paenibacillus TaxID=185978 RepID=UPI00110FF2F3|nr:MULTISPECIES: hypothetical protein [unclassified Paenibacillus]
MKKFVVIILCFLTTLMTACGQTETEIKRAAVDNQQFTIVSVDRADTASSIITVKHQKTGCYFALSTSDRNTAGLGSLTQIYDNKGAPFCE